nr:EamA family transporter [Candidatus Gracilibacteria bacterium]
MKYKLLLLLILGGGFLTLGDIFLKKWALDNTIFMYAFSMILYLVGINFFALTLKESNLAIASTILVTANTVILVIVSYFYFKEKFTLLQAIGIILSVFGVILLEWE